MGLEIVQASEKRGLEANTKKTKYMSNGKVGLEEKFKIKESELEKVSEYIHTWTSSII